MNKRLSDVYYTTNRLQGTPEPPGQAIAPAFYQGETIIMTVMLNVDDCPATTKNWDLSVIVKKNVYSTQTIWTGEFNNGIYQVDNISGVFKVIIEQEISNTLIPGTYWLDIIGKDKTETEVKPVSVVLLHTPFTIDYSNSSTVIDSTTRADQDKTYPPATDATVE